MDIGPTMLVLCPQISLGRHCGVVHPYLQIHRHCSREHTWFLLLRRKRLFGISRGELCVVARMTGARWQSRNRFKGFDAAYFVFARTVDLNGRCLIDRLGDRMASGIQTLQTCYFHGAVCKATWSGACN